MVKASSGQKVGKVKNSKKVLYTLKASLSVFHQFKSVKNLVQNLLLYSKEYSTPPKMKSNFVPVFSHSWASRQKGQKRHNFS